MAKTKQNPPKIDPERLKLLKKVMSEDVSKSPSMGEVADILNSNATNVLDIIKRLEFVEEDRMKAKTQNMELRSQVETQKRQIIDLDRKLKKQSQFAKV